MRLMLLSWKACLQEVMEESVQLFMKLTNQAVYSMPGQIISIVRNGMLHGKELNISLDFYAYRQRDLDEILPWDFIDIGVTKNFMKREWNRAVNEQVVTQNCRAKCSGCGAMSFGGGICYEGKN